MKAVSWVDSMAGMLADCLVAKKVQLLAVLTAATMAGAWAAQKVASKAESWAGWTVDGMVDRTV